MLSASVVFEDDNLLILHKPSGMPSVSLSKDESGTAVEAALKHYPELAKLQSKKELEPGLLHRLDTGTSGLLCFAKSNQEHERLKALWKTEEVKKVYRALVSVNPPVPLGINTPLGHSAKSSKRMLPVLRDQDRRRIRGKPLKAQTLILKSNRVSQDRFDLTIAIETGVMHQIRCHLASIQCPVIGDKVYHGAPGPRLFLHAWRLELPLRSGVKLNIEARIPELWNLEAVSE